jgi:hypothetical protein
MGRGLRERRLHELLDRFPRRVLYQVARAVDAPIGSETYKHELIDALARLRSPVLEAGFADALTAPDLRALCARAGFSNAGNKGALAARLLAAVDDLEVSFTRWRPFKDARAFARSLSLCSQNEWWAFTRGELRGKGRLPSDIPKAPHMTYRGKGWTNWGDFLGTDNPARHLVTYRPFRQARAYARRLGLSSASEWRAYCARRDGNRRLLPPDIPAAPYQVYAEWVSFGDWLGTGRVHASKVRYRTYNEARAYVRRLGIRTEPEWRAWCRGERSDLPSRPPDIPSNPQRTYRDSGWMSWGEFLGTGSVAVYQRSFRPFRAARAYVRAQKLADNKEWRAWCAAGRRPADIPASPDQVYRDKGWVSWGDFLGNRKVHPSRKAWRSLPQARAVVRRLGIRNRAEFLKAKRAGRIPDDIPLMIERHPDWTSWRDFLGTQRR